jgi:glycine C-acetyltransferase
MILYFKRNMETRKGISMETITLKPFQLPKMIWPVEWGKANGFYFYMEPIEELHNGRVIVRDRGEMIMLSSYSYLGLLGHPRINSAAKMAIDSFSTGTHGVRLLSGTLNLHNELEKRIAHFKDTESAIVFSSGYITNLSTISVLVKQGDLIICDKLNHASIVDGCRLSGARFITFRHNDMEHLEQLLLEVDPDVNKMVVADAVFSMDGDILNLPDVSRLCRQHGALLMVDEAHSLGMLGRTGHGIEEHFDLPPDTIDVKMGTLSKTIPSVGGYIAGSARLIGLLRHQARAFIFSAALPPAQTAAALEAFDVIEDEPERIDLLQRNVTHFINHARGLSFDILNAETAIVPIICGDEEKAWIMAKHCQDKGLFIQGIPYPVVPRGTALLRCIITASHTFEDLDYSLDVIEQAGKITGILN